MSEIIKTALTDKNARNDSLLRVAASEAASKLAPWGSRAEG
jgi:hypothetical protein